MIEMIKEMLYEALIVDWYYGLALTVMVAFVFLVSLEKIDEKLGRIEAW